MHGFFVGSLRTTLEIAKNKLSQKYNLGPTQIQKIRQILSYGIAVMSGPTLDSIT